ncbi:hypothetical protein AHAS_Ahas12G0167500 [Arachis hypogaea]
MRWVKINTWSFDWKPWRSWMWGLIRDEQGRRVAGFTMNIGICTAFQAEMWGFYRG